MLAWPCLLFESVPLLRGYSPRNFARAQLPNEFPAAPKVSWASRDVIFVIASGNFHSSHPCATQHGHLATDSDFWEKSTLEDLAGKSLQGMKFFADETSPGVHLPCVLLLSQSEMAVSHPHVVVFASSIHGTFL